VNLRGIGDYLDGLATVLETQIAPAPQNIFASSLAQQEEERTEEIPSENDGDDDDDDGVYGMIKDRKKGWFGF